MKKTASLAAYLRANVPKLRTSPEDLVIRPDEGRVIPRGGGTFEWRADVRVALFDLPAADLDAVVVGILFWLAINQRDVIENKDRADEGLRWERDELETDGRINFFCELPLTETVRVRPRQAAGDFDIDPLDEPALDDVFTGLETVRPKPLLKRLFVNGEQLLGAPPP